MSVSFDGASTLQAATSHQCSRDADGDGEGGRNGYPSDSVVSALIRDKLHVVSSENHDQIKEEASDSEETPCSSSGPDGEGVGATARTPIVNSPGAFWQEVATSLYQACAQWPRRRGFWQLTSISGTDSASGADFVCPANDSKHSIKSHLFVWCITPWDAHDGGQRWFSCAKILLFTADLSIIFFWRLFSFLNYAT